MKRNATKGAVAAAVAFLTWGLSPVYWKALAHVPSSRLLAHRIVWSMVFMLGLVAVRRGYPALRAALRSPRTLGMVALSGTLLAVNWIVFLWGVTHGHIVECSLGYFISPLVSVSLGAVFLRERLNAFHVTAVCLAGAGVLNLVVWYGHVPWIGLSLASTFGLYGLIRKTSHLESVTGFAAESMVIGLPALLYLLPASSHASEPATVLPLSDALLLGGTGLITALPLLFFAYGARQIRLSTLGFMQYIAPTCQFLLGVFAYNEDFSIHHRITFILIWLGVAAYCRGLGTWPWLQRAGERRTRDEEPRMNTS